MLAMTEAVGVGWYGVAIIVAVYNGPAGVVNTGVREAAGVVNSGVREAAGVVNSGAREAMTVAVLS